MFTGTYQGLQAGKAIFIGQDGQQHGIFVPDNLQAQLTTTPLGAVCMYDGVKPPGKNYYRMTTFTPGVPAPAGMTPVAQAMPQMPQAQPPTPALQYVPCAPAKQVSDEFERAIHIFVTGIIGRALHGTGSVPDYNTLASMVYNARRAFIEGMTEPLKPVQPAQQEGPPSWHDAPPV